ncbi:MAG: VOC family protein [Alphaproteobacteria bacterium]|nr:VOC family protein [Alphaproteobacteria bacterium]
MNGTIPLNPLIPELLCSDFEASLHFYRTVLGFKVLYRRKAEGFAMLERQGAQLMLDRNRPGNWVSARLRQPYGRGLNLQIKTRSVRRLYASLQKKKAKIFLPLEDAWYRADKVFLGCRQFIVSDPDGYLLRFYEDLGVRENVPH